jgi:hypothetical protein
MDCSNHLNSPFEISEIQKTLVLHTLSVDRRHVLWFVRPLKRVDNFRNENEENNMISKITAILAAALVLGSAGAASAQPHRQAGWQAPYANSYNQDTRNLRYGHANDLQLDPLAGTVFDGVAPY